MVPVVSAWVRPTADAPDEDAVSGVGETDRARALDALVDSDALSVAFQPIVDLSRGQAFGYEVLGRVARVGGALGAIAPGPAALLDAAHAAGRLLKLDRRWRSIAIDAIAAMPDTGTLFFLNVDPRVVDDPAYSRGYTRDLLRRHALDPRRFVLELTEAPSVDRASIEAILAEYAAQGFATALDDFGAPLQSLATLLRVRPAYLKVDGAVVHGIERDELRQNLLRSLVEFAERAHIRLVVEGVETEAELRTARDLGAKLVQGFYLGRPTAKPTPFAPRTAVALRGQHARDAARKTRALETSLLPLVEVVESIAVTSVLEPMLQHVTAFAAELLGVDRASIRLLDESRTRLLVAARTGPSLSADIDFAVGEGLVGWVVAHRRPLLTGQADSDPRFTPKREVRPFASFLGVPLLDEEGCIGVLTTSSDEADAFSLEDERRLRLVAAVVAPRLQVARLRRLLVTDPLTCVWNRRALDELLPVAASETSLPLAVAAVDIDRFKAINDRSGHAAGDEALRAVAQALSSAVRESDHVVRVGGEELLLVLRGAEMEQALAVAERARLAVRASKAHSELPVTISVGVAAWSSGESRDELIERADAALYRAKNSGRDCVEAALPPGRARRST